MKKCYIAGPISTWGYRKSYEMFAAAEVAVREAGYVPVNPMRFRVSRWKWLYRLVGYNVVLLYDVWRLIHCDNIYKLPGWRASKGANIESCAAYHYNVHPIAQTKYFSIDAAMRKKAAELGVIIEEREKTPSNPTCRGK